MKQFALLTLLAVFLTGMTTFAAHAAHAAETPSERVTVMYFHRTERCPTCRKMGSYSEEAVKAAFAKQISSGNVAFHYVDFQKPENATLAKGYKIAGPALVVTKIKDNKVERWKPLPKIWELVSKKDDFYKYVQKNVREHLGN